MISLADLFKIGVALSALFLTLFQSEIEGFLVFFLGNAIFLFAQFGNFLVTVCFSLFNALTRLLIHIKDHAKHLFHSLTSLRLLILSHIIALLNKKAMVILYNLLPFF